LGAAASTVSAPLILPSYVALGNEAVSPNERIRIGQIGRGCVGRGHLRRLAWEPSIELVALCEVDRSRLEDGLAEVAAAHAMRADGGSQPGCKGYNDYRELLARDDIDAVVIVTPDHWHTPQSIHAVEAGKDVYCEKPISISVDEGRQLADAVRRHGRVFQNGSQYRTRTEIRRACDFIRKGGLGRIKSVFTTWGPLGVLHSNRLKPYAAFTNPKVMGSSMTPMDFALPAEPVPDGLDWDLWVGPALWRPYSRAYHANPIPGVVPWSFCEDFGVAASTGYHSHAADVIQYALGVEESNPVEFLHPADSDFPTLTYRYENGVHLHLAKNWKQAQELYDVLPKDVQFDGNFGGIFVGERGWLTTMSSGSGVKGGPDDLMAEYKLPIHDVDMGGKDHHANWLECIRTREKPYSHAEIGHRTAALGHLTIIAYKLGRSLKWDPVREVFPEDDQANRLLRRAKRAPWRI
jgi:predicted dehydrogenase